MEREDAIIESWEANARNWIESIEQKLLESRILATNDAIVRSVLASKPTHVLDVGCGEGWLCEVLSSQGILVTGVDAIPSLIEAAKSKSKGTYLVATYEAIGKKQVIFEQPFDVIICNFSLLGKDSVAQLLPALLDWLKPNGKVIVQTLHPKSRSQDSVSGWKTGSWDGLGPNYTQAYEWYYRTMEDWMDLFNNSGYSTIKSQDIQHPITHNLLSIIYTLSR